MTSCPLALMDWSLLMNYYNQRVLDLAYSEGATNPNTDFPNAIYLDAVDTSGLIRTGTSKINPLLQEHLTDGYAYAATLIAANVRRLCRGRSDCFNLQKSIEDERAQYPLSLWDDPKHGRLLSWPSLQANPVMLGVISLFMRHLRPKRVAAPHPNPKAHQESVKNNEHHDCWHMNARLARCVQPPSTWRSHP